MVSRDTEFPGLAAGCIQRPFVGQADPVRTLMGDTSQKDVVTAALFQPLDICSWQRLLPVVRPPFCVVFTLIVRLVGQMNTQSPVVQREVQVKIAPTCSNSHPPLVDRKGVV